MFLVLSSYKARFMVWGILACSCNVFGQELCGLTVVATYSIGSDGTRPSSPGLEVRLVKEDGTLLQSTKTGAEGRAYFCDIGFEKVSVEVGKKGTCGFTVVHGVEVQMPMPLTLRVYENHCLGPRSGTLFSCIYYLRFIDGKGNPLEGVTVGNLTTDRFGRLIMVVDQGETAKHQAVKSGFEQQDFTLTCSTLDYYRKQVVLKARVE
jgi:hypothetical protein